MKIALLCHGQPRFTNAFNIMMTQLKGFTQADFYMGFWATPWAPNEASFRAMAEPAMFPGYNLKGVAIVPQHEYKLPNPQLEHNTEEPESVRWWYKRRWSMWRSLKMTYDLINEDYDMLIKFRPDGRLDREVDVRTIDLTNDMVYPSNHRNGMEGMKLCEQFVFDSPDGMKFYAGLTDYFDEYIPKIDPNWEQNVHPWSSEHILGYHMLSNNKTLSIGDYQHLLRVDGISPNDDKWYTGS